MLPYQILSNRINGFIRIKLSFLVKTAKKLE